MIRDYFRKILTGLTIPQEYICIDEAEFENPFSFIVLDRLDLPVDITRTHLFLGYKPLIIGIIEKNIHVSRFLHSIEIKVLYEAGAPDNILARLTLKKIHKKQVGEYWISFFEAIEGHHKFLNPFHQYAGKLIQHLKTHPPGNIGLPGNLYDQVRIAYSKPRKISIVTLGQGSGMNMFPTDLHGPVGNNFYVSSLRLGSQANKQLEEAGNIVLSDIRASSYTKAYALGKNHMKDLQEKIHFPLHQEPSESFGIPIPEGVTSYAEMKRIDSWDHGIHRMHFYEIVNRKSVDASNSSLAHIHQYYAQWRLGHNLETKMLLR